MDDRDPPPGGAEATGDIKDADLRFLSGPTDNACDSFPAYVFRAGLRPDLAEADIVDAWKTAEAGLAVRLARLAARLGMLDERLRRGPAGWHHAFIALDELTVPHA